MPRLKPLPRQLGNSFSVADARALGVSADRLRNKELQRPFHGVRTRSTDDERVHSEDPFTPLRQQELARIRALSHRLTPDQFFSHRSAAMIWGIPLPQRGIGEIHLSAHSPNHAPRVQDVVGHRVESKRCPVVTCGGLRTSSPAATWVMLASLGFTVPELVVAGDAIVRKYRTGFGRPHAGQQPLGTREQLAKILRLGRWRGAPQLNAALELIREDSWSPQESLVRVELVQSGLPEPLLNQDCFTEEGRFLGCLDMAYPEFRIGTEYHGAQHRLQYAKDVDRMAAFRHEGWEILEVTSETLRHSGLVSQRVEAALRRRGWKP